MARIEMTIAGRRLTFVSQPCRHNLVRRCSSCFDKSVVNLDLDALSLPEDILVNIRELVDRPKGSSLSLTPRLEKPPLSIARFAK